MASEKLNQIIEEISSLTVLELSELVKALEDKFGVQAAAPVMAMAPGAMPGGAAGAAAEEEKTSFTVVLKEVGPNKIQVIKEIRAITNLGLKEAKELVDKAPSKVKENVSKEEAEEIKNKLTAAGAVVELE